MPGIIRSFDWLVVGEKGIPLEEVGWRTRLCRSVLYEIKNRSVSNLIINEMLVEAAGVELITMLITRKLLIL